MFYERVPNLESSFQIPEVDSGCQLVFDIDSNLSYKP